MKLSSQFLQGRVKTNMEDSQIDKLFAGDMDNLPIWRQPLIRIYLSSTYTGCSKILEQLESQEKQFKTKLLVKSWLDFTIKSLLGSIQVPGTS